MSDIREDIKQVLNDCKDQKTYHVVSPAYEDLLFEAGRIAEALKEAIEIIETVQERTPDLILESICIKFLVKHGV